MPKTTIAPSPADLQAYARIGAQVHLQRLDDERDRIVAAFPELRQLRDPERAQRDRDFAPLQRHRDATTTHTHTCASCARGFTPDSQHRAQKTCGRVPCVKAYKREYMRAYFAKRAAKANGATS